MMHKWKDLYVLLGAHRTDSPEQLEKAFQSAYEQALQQQALLADDAALESLSGETEIDQPQKEAYNQRRVSEQVAAYQN